MTKTFDGWRLLFVFWLILMISSSIPLYAGGVLNAYMALDLQIDRTMLSLPMSILQLTFGLVAPATAIIINRVGIRITLAIGGLLGIIGSLAMALFVTDVLTATLSFGVLIGLGYGIAGGIPTQVGVTRWFMRKRALAMALLFTAPGIGGFFAAPLMNKLITATGGEWQYGWFLAAGFFCLLILLSLLFVKEDPADVGQLPDGANAASAAENDAKNKTQTDVPHFISRETWAFKDVSRNWVYWVMQVTGVSVNIGFTLYFAVGIVHLTEFGHSADATSWALGVFGISALLAKFVLGALGDKMDPKYIWAFMIALFGVGLFVISNGEGEWVILTFPILMGAGFGGHIASMMAVLSNYYGRAAFPAVAGVAVAVTTCTGAIIPMFAGSFYAAFGSYSPAFLSLSAWCVIGAIIMAALPRPRKNQ